MRLQQFQPGTTFKEKAEQAKTAWDGLSDEQRQAFRLTVHNRMKKAEELQMSYTQVTDENMQLESCGLTTQPPANCMGKEADHRYAYILTWHDHSCVHNTQLQAACEQLKKVPQDSEQYYDFLRNNIARLPCIIQARDKFRSWWGQFYPAKQMPRWSYQLELTLAGDRLGQIHHHWVMSADSTQKDRHSPRWLTHELWAKIQYSNWLVDIKPCQAPPRNMAASANRLHAYVQVLHGDTNM